MHYIYKPQSCNQYKKVEEPLQSTVFLFRSPH